MARMGLSGLYDSRAEAFEELAASFVRIPLKQHIGAVASPLVAAGERVARGQLIASCGAKIGANIHASISGVVTKVDDAVEITGEE